MRRLLGWAVVALVCVALAPTPGMSADAIHLVIGGVEVVCDVPPLLIDGRMLVPIRVISEKLGCTVAWHPAIQTVTVSGPGSTHAIPPVTPGRVHLVINGVEAYPDVPPQIVNGRVMVPIRFVSEAFGFTVGWLPKAHAVLIGPQRPLLEVHFIDVGHGNCTFVKLPHGETMLIDSGDDAHVDSVLAYLDAQGVTSLDYIIATHPDPEHVAGLDEVVEKLPVGMVVMSDQTGESAICADLMAVIQDKGVVVYEPSMLMHLVSKYATTVCVFGSPRAYDNVNDGSIAVEIWNGAILIALLSDRETQGLEDLIMTPEFYLADVLGVGNHGSDTSSTLRMTAPGQPDYAIISVGADNQCGCPAPSTLEALEAAGAAIYRTDLHGTIVVFATERSAWVVTEAIP